MSQEVKYGFISDAHDDPYTAVRATSLFTGLGIDKLILNGDIDLAALSSILKQTAQSGLETFVQPGSHEQISQYTTILDKFIQKYDNFHDTTVKQKFEMEGHHLIFAPGSDSVCGGEFMLGDMLPTARYFDMIIDSESGAKRAVVPMRNCVKYLKVLNQGAKSDGIFQYFNMQDLYRLVTEPKKTILISHIPRKFNMPNAVDRAEFGVASESFNLGKSFVPKGSIFKLKNARNLVAQGVPIEIKNENVGSECLAQFIHERGITKAVNGHIHEASHRAHDVRCNNVPENQFTNELFWNSGCMDKGHCGILTVRGEEVSYQNIDLNDYK